jgi:hypothetical protein
MPPQSRLPHVRPANEVCLELTDNSVIRKSAADFFRVEARNPAPLAATLAEQFINVNRRLSSLLDVRIECNYDGNDVFLALYSGNAVGAIPLISPRSGGHDLGLVVQPRFRWDGLGPMLSEMGWRVAPSPLRLPLLHRSERRVPLWVLSSMVLTRVAALLDSLTPKFAMVREHPNSPRGMIDWSEYVRRSMPSGNFLSLPCVFPDLRDDHRLKGAIRYTLDRQIQSLQSQRHHGSFVHRLIEFAQGLLQRVLSVFVYIPTPRDLQNWMQRPMRNDKFLDGLQAIEWTIEERGLAGMSDLQGLPWRMPMDQFFEAWIETIFTLVARKTGARIRTGRQHQTNHPIDWRPAYLGSQKSLVPDMWLEWSAVTLIIDAKYKRHWDELNRHSWSGVDEELRENHRADLFQVLAYANLAKTPIVIACLAYPCSPKTWKALEESHRLNHRAIIAVGSRAVHLWLTAVPMMADAEKISCLFSESVRDILAA